MIATEPHTFITTKIFQITWRRFFFEWDRKDEEVTTKAGDNAK